MRASNHFLRTFNTSLSIKQKKKGRGRVDRRAPCVSVFLDPLKFREDLEI